MTALPEFPAHKGDSDRVASVDALRGLIILLMVFVNDVAGAAHAPSWLHHVGADYDGMTLPDIVFPAFLFIAGVSIPLAFRRAVALGQTRTQLLGKVVTRTFALLVMGVVMVNGEEHQPWERGLWSALAFAAMFLAFAVVPTETGRARNFLRIGRVVGAVALIALALAYRDADGHAMVFGPMFDSADTVWLRHSWWGILGLIGWAYLAASIVYLILGHRREWLVGAAGALTLLYVATDSGLAEQLASRSWLAWAAPLISGVGALLGAINDHVGIGSTLGSQAGLTVAGCCLGSILTADSEVRSHAERLRWALTFAAGLFILGVLLDAPAGINKIHATPAWCLYSAAITTALWALLYWVMDVRDARGWSRLVRPAGANPLLAYVLHPFLYMLAGLAGGGVSSIVFFYHGLPAVAAVLGSLLMAFAIVQATGWIAQRGFRLKV